MSAESGFLRSLGQALATMALHDEGDPARDRAIDASFERLLDLDRAGSSVEFSFLGAETFAGNRPLVELDRWDWAERLSAARIERIEIDAEVDRESFVGFVEALFQRLHGRCAETALARQMVRPPIRFGRLEVRDPGASHLDGSRSAPERIDGVEGMAEGVAAVDHIRDEVSRSGQIPMAEVEAVVQALAATMHREEEMLMPLLTLKQYDQYTTTHACNVAVLAMGLAERLGFSPREIRAIGVAGLLHDIGKVAIPHELLVKPGRYTPAEREVIQRHPVEGARMILQRERGLGLAAVVAYEHHIYLDGGGYPALRFQRACHYASRIVHVCDVYDALCTDRPYRKAWEPEQALSYLHEQAGRELDPDIVRAFSEMIGEALVRRLDMDAGAKKPQSAADMILPKPPAMARSGRP